MYPQPYIKYLVYFHGPRDYFECHEVLEEFWKKDENQVKDSFWVGLIQVAVALYHHRNGNLNGAFRTLNKAIQIISTNRGFLNQYGIEAETFIKMLNARLINIKNQTPYTSLNIPLKDPKLIEQCKLICEEMGAHWGQPSDMSNQFIMNKHRLRDRTEVIKEREKQKQLRNNFK